MSDLTGIIRQYRDSHHRIAELIALGCTDSMIRQQLGVSSRRLALLQADPTFRELIAAKSAKAAEVMAAAKDEMTEIEVSTMLTGAAMVRDGVDQSAHAEPGEERVFTPMQVHRIVMDLADRFGYGKNQTVKVEHDIASRLDRAIARSGVRLVESQVIEAEILEPHAPTPERAPVRSSQPTTPVSAVPRVRRIA